MAPQCSFGRRSEYADVPASRAMLNASSPKCDSAFVSCVRIRKRRSISFACDRPVARIDGTGCGRSFCPSCRAKRSPWSRWPPTSGGDVNDVVPADDREVHLALGLVVLRLLGRAEDEVHVGVESFEDSAIPTPAFQLNHHIRIDPLVEERKRLDHRTTPQPWRRRTSRYVGV